MGKVRIVKEAKKPDVIIGKTGSITFTGSKTITVLDESIPCKGSKLALSKIKAGNDISNGDN